MKRRFIQFIQATFIVVFALTLVQCQSENSGNGGETEVTDPMKDEAGLEKLTPEEVADMGLEDAASDLPQTTMTFEEESFDFGEVEEGSKVSHIFKFTNTGDEPLVIQSARGSCGCTVPKYTDAPVAPGETGEINVEFDTSGKPGNQSKSVTVNANIEGGTKILRISGQVTPKAK